MQLIVLYLRPLPSYGKLDFWITSSKFDALTESFFLRNLLIYLLLHALLRSGLLLPSEGNRCLCSSRQGAVAMEKARHVYPG